MKFVINNSFGGFYISREDSIKIGIDRYAMNINDRANPELIKLADKYSHLSVVEIPDEATDYKLCEYDGAESILFVIDGKIHEAGYYDVCF